MQISNFSIFKNTKKEKPTQPDYTISTKVGEEFKVVGACWLKDSANGKYFSCKVDDTPYVKPAQPKTEYPSEDIDASQIPF
jgi:uncharacterized protein (DUF736 family)